MEGSVSQAPFYHLSSWGLGYFSIAAQLRIVPLDHHYLASTSLAKSDALLCSLFSHLFVSGLAMMSKLQGKGYLNPA
jgi:hypothetical protein